VVTTQISAIILYKKFGFKIIAKLNKDMKIGNKYYDEYLMEKELG
jgi:ribosomal protein S18 acetylase RimI-like enzyme